MRFSPDYNIPVDMRSLFIKAKDYGPGDVTTYSKSWISFKQGFSYGGYFKWKKKGDKRILNWKKSTLTDYTQGYFRAYDFHIPGKKYLKAVKKNDGEKLRQLALAGDDYITGSRGNDVLVGETGNDHIIGGSGDLLIGGPGADLFETRNLTTIADFNPAEGDLIRQTFVSRHLDPLVMPVDGGIQVQLPGSWNSGPNGGYNLPFILQGHSSFDFSWVEV